MVAPRWGSNRTAQGSALGIGAGETSVSPNGAAQAQSHTYLSKDSRQRLRHLHALAYAALSGLGRRSESSTQGVALGFPIVPFQGTY